MSSHAHMRSHGQTKYAYICTYLSPLLLLQIRRASVAIQHVVVGVNIQTLRVEGDGFFIPRQRGRGREGDGER